MESKKIDNEDQIINFLNNESFDIKKLVKFVQVLMNKEEESLQQEDASEALGYILRHFFGKEGENPENPIKTLLNSNIVSYLPIYRR